MKRTGYSATLVKVVGCVCMYGASLTRTSNFQTFMPKFAGRRSLITSSTVLFYCDHQARHKSQIYALTPYECVHCTRMPHLIWSRNNCPTGKGSHTPQRTTLISHFTSLMLPLRFTPTHLTPRASYRTPRIMNLIANTSFLFSHFAAQTHISHCISHIAIT